MSNSNGNPSTLRPPWKPGESGNPGGRPKGDAWYRKLCRKRTVKALKALDRVMEGNDPGPIVSAAKAVLEYAWGRAPGVVVIPNDDGVISDAEADELEKRLDS